MLIQGAGPAQARDSSSATCACVEVVLCPRRRRAAPLVCDESVLRECASVARAQPGDPAAASLPPLPVGARNRAPTELQRDPGPWMTIPDLAQLPGLDEKSIPATMLLAGFGLCVD